MDHPLRFGFASGLQNATSARAAPVGVLKLCRPLVSALADRCVLCGGRGVACDRRTPMSVRS